MKSGNLNFLEPSAPLQARNGTALPFLTSFLLQTGILLVLKMRISPLKAVSDIKGQLALLVVSLMIIKIWAVSGTTKTYECQQNRHPSQLAIRIHHPESCYKSMPNLYTDILYYRITVIQKLILWQLTKTVPSPLRVSLD